MTLQQRYAAPTPDFFKAVSRWGLLLAAAGGTLLASPIAMPAILVEIAEYLTIAGAVATAVSQAATTAGDSQE